MKNFGVKYGLVGSLILLVYFLAVYAMGINAFLNPIFQWMSMVIYVYFMYRGSKDDMAQNGASRDFRELLRTPFVVFLLINLTYWLFYYGLNLFDPAILKMQTALQITDLQAKIDAGMGDPEQSNQIREQIQYLEKDGMSLPLGPVMMRMGMGAIGGFGIAAMISTIIRGDK
jgi:hypothetical protein